jgi:hypothetical protein
MKKKKKEKYEGFPRPGGDFVAPGKKWYPLPFRQEKGDPPTLWSPLSWLKRKRKSFNYQVLDEFFAYLFSN